MKKKENKKITITAVASKRYRYQYKTFPSIRYYIID